MCNSHYTSQMLMVIEGGEIEDNPFGVESTKALIMLSDYGSILRSVTPRDQVTSPKAKEASRCG